MKDDKMMKAAGKVGLAVLVSRILGLVRDQVFAFFFGAGFLMDCFQAAFRIPNLLRDLFAEGALSSAFVTVFSRTRKQEGDERAWELARIVMTLQVLLLSSITILGIIFAPQLVRLIAPGFAAIAGKTDLTITLTRVLFPFILFVGMAALTMGILNAYQRFGLPASASSFFNLGSVVVGLGLALYFDSQFSWRAIICMAIGSVVGGFLQWFVQVPALRKLGYRYRFTWNLKDKGLHEILRLMGPTMIGASAVQVNVMINAAFASQLGNGPISWLALAFRLIQLPIGLFGVAISTAALPSLAVEATHENKEAFRTRVEKALRMNAALCIPSACGLAILSVPLVGVLFEHGGQFSIVDTSETAKVLSAYAIGLVGYASLKVLTSAFYALGQTRLPMFISFLSIIVTASLNGWFIYYAKVGAIGLAFSTSVAALLNAAILLFNLRGAVGSFAAATWGAMVKILAASAAMSLVLLVSQWVHQKLGISHGFVSHLSRTVAGVGLGGIVYIATARALHLEEVKDILTSISKKLGLSNS
jgi:putative peptidoglycan lipid II flippase